VPPRNIWPKYAALSACAKRRGHGKDCEVTPPRKLIRHPQRSLNSTRYYHMNKPRAIGKRWKSEDIEVFARAICGIELIGLLSLGTMRPSDE
jgi:hypothetical protein